MAGTKIDLAESSEATKSSIRTGGYDGNAGVKSKEKTYKDTERKAQRYIKCIMIFYVIFYVYAIDTSVTI